LGHSEIADTPSCAVKLVREAQPGAAGGAELSFNADGKYCKGSTPTESFVGLWTENCPEPSKQNNPIVETPPGAESFAVGIVFLCLLPVYVCSVVLNAGASGGAFQLPRVLY
jgi:hypothetical protein